MKKYTPNPCTTSKSFPDLLLFSKLNRELQPYRSHSLTFCLKFSQQKSILLKTEKKNLNPTIGELLGDDDVFHSRYHHRYSASTRFQGKRTHSRSSHIYTRRKQQRSDYFDPTQHQSLSSFESIPNSNQFYPYSTTYSYPSLSAYCYYCYSNMASCCPCLISDCYTGLYNQEISYESSTFQSSYQRTEDYLYLTDYYHAKKNLSRSRSSLSKR